MKKRKKASFIANSKLVSKVSLIKQNKELLERCYSLQDQLNYYTHFFRIEENTDPWIHKSRYENEMASSDMGSRWWR